MMNGLWQDLRFGIRMLVKNRSVTLVAVIALALGIGANTAIFSIVNTVLLRPLPFPEPDRLVGFYESQPNLEQAPFSAADFLDFQTQNRSFEAMAALRRLNFNLTEHVPAERIPGMVASVSVFSLLGVQAVLGRSLLSGDGKHGAPRVALLSYGFWQSHFGGDRGVVGQSMTLNGEPVTVIGVLPASFHYGGNVQLWLNPRDIVPEVFPNWSRDIPSNRQMHYLSIVGRLKPGVTLAQAQADLHMIFDRLHRQFPITVGHEVHLLSLQEQAVGPVRPFLVVLLGVVGLVLLIACANVANLLLARAAARRREIAIRLALGAGRLRITRQLLTEAILLAVVSGGLGLVLAGGLIKLIAAAHPTDLPRIAELSVDLRVLGFTLAVSLATGILFGLAPALHGARQCLGEALKETGRSGTAGIRHARVRNVLVVSGIAISLVLLVGAGLLGQSFLRLLEVDPGFRTDHLVTMWMNFSGVRYSAEGNIARFVDQLLPRVAALPGVEGVAIANDLPLEGDDTTTGADHVEGQAPFLPGQAPIVGVHAVNPGYFRSMGIVVLRGREFTDADRSGSSPVVIINKKLADTFWPGKDPLGKHFTLLSQQPVEVVGVVVSVLHNGLGDPETLEGYIPFAQTPWSYIALVIRSRQNPAALYSAVRSLATQIDPDLPVHDPRPMDQVVADTLVTRRLTLYLVGSFAALALVLAAVGIYGVMSYAVSERVHEIGIRVALGAHAGDVLRLVVRQGMRLALAGLAVGVVGALAAARTIRSMLFNIAPSDPLTYLALAALLALVALAACAIPARRAATVDPMELLRYE